MSKLQIILLTSAISFTILASILSSNKQVLSIGSVSRANEYLSTTTKPYFGSPIADPTTLCQTGGVLGSVIITGANTGVMNFYDATTTASHADHATTTIATIPASAAAGTYTFDVATVRGLVYDLDSGITATSTITYRCN